MALTLLPKRKLKKVRKLKCISMKKRPQLSRRRRLLKEAKKSLKLKSKGDNQMILKKPKLILRINRRLGTIYSPRLKSLWI